MDMENPVKAIAVWDEVVRQFGDTTEPKIREKVAQAMINKGVALGKQGKPLEAIAVWDEVVRRFGNATEPGIRELVAKAMVNKGLALCDGLGKPVEAILVWYEVVRRFEDAAEPGIRKQVASAMFNKGVALYELKRYEDARKAFEQAAQRGHSKARHMLEILT